MKRFRLWVLLAVVALAAAAHYVYWYMPRERAGAPDAEDLPARLLTSGAYDACLWLPYPHQNAGALEEEVGEWPAYVAAAARAAGAPPPALQSFGPFQLPPAREIVACSDLAGGRIFVAARIYPALAAVARLAGRLAGNPWLAGGEVADSELQRESPAALHVAWRDGVWTVTSGEPPKLPPRAVRNFPETLAVLRLGREVSRFPPGSYLLRREGNDLDLALSAEETPAVPPVREPDFGKTPPALVAVAGAAWPADEESPLPPSAIALFSETAGERRGASNEDLQKLPGAAVFHPPDSGDRWSLPGQGLPRFLIGVLPHGEAEGWEITALDSASLARAKALAPQISTLVPPVSGDTGGTETRLVLGLWAHPKETRAVVSRVRHILEAIPLVDRKQVERWRDWETLLGPLARCRQITLLTTELPSTFRLHISACGA
jgi:hypothetical protein